MGYDDVVGMGLYCCGDDSHEEILMGDVAEMVLEGILCEFCGAHIGDAVGHTRACGDCADDAGSNVSDGFEDDDTD